MQHPLKASQLPRVGTPDVLGRVQDVIKRTVTPSWIGSVPNNFGEAKAGTIKADQWRSLWTIYIPIAFVSLWGDGVPLPDSNASSMKRVLRTSMALSAVATLACFRSTTRKRADNLRESLWEHIEGLKVLFPGFLLPSHHLAFHIYDFLLLFGPAKSWWCFPFERLIGQLQRQPHNHRFGEPNPILLCSKPNLQRR
jgi:hypothetical protein